jgi:hypothetical protein
MYKYVHQLLLILSTCIQYILPYLAFVVVIILVFKTNLTYQTDRIIFGWDTLDFFYNTLIFIHNQINQGIIPWWNPYLTAGFPVAVLGISLFYPLNILFDIFPVATVFPYYIAIHILLTMIFMYWCCRIFISKIASWFGAIAFSLSGFFIPRVYTGEINHSVSSAYLPLIFGLMWKAFHAKAYRNTIKVSLFAALILGIQIIASGDPRISLITIFIVCITGICTALYNKTVKPIIGICIMVFWGLGISSIQNIPLIQLAQFSQRSNTSNYQFSIGGALKLSDFSQLFYPFTIKFIPNTHSYPPFIESPFYVSITALILALPIIIITGTQIIKKNQYKPNTKTLREPIIILTITAFIGIWLALGPNAPFDIFYILWKFIPLFSFVRFLSRFSFIFIFCVCLLSAFTINFIKSIWIRLLLTFILLIELIPFSSQFILSVPIPEQSYNQKLISNLKSPTGLFRLHQNYFYTERLGNSMDMNTPNIYNIFASNGYVSLLLKNYVNFYTDTLLPTNDKSYTNMDQMLPLPNFNQPGIDFLNIRYIYGDYNLNPQDSENPNRYKELIADPYSWFKLFENTQYMPRFFISPNVVLYRNQSNLQKDMIIRKYDIHTTALIYNPKNNSVKQSFTSDCLNQQIQNVTLLSYDVNKIILRANPSCTAYLISSEVMYPGWKAYIDGKDTQIFTANEAFRSILVPEGPHTIIFQYHPDIFIYGSLITLIFLVTSLIFIKKIK